MVISMTMDEKFLYFAVIVFVIVVLWVFCKTKLTSEKMEMIKSKGVCHLTSEEGASGIVLTKVILPTSGVMAYSNFGNSCTYFAINDDINYVAQYNENKKYVKRIIIKFLNSEQIDNFYYRRIDNALIYKGCFIIDQANKVVVEDITDIDTEQNKCQIRRVLRNLYIIFFKSTIYGKLFFFSFVFLVITILVTR